MPDEIDNFFTDMGPDTDAVGAMLPEGAKCVIETKEVIDGGNMITVLIEGSFSDLPEGAPNQVIE